MSDINYPKSVIRFFGNTNFALACIAQRKITFVHASKLNDPFDPVFYLPTEFDDNYEELLNWIAKNHKERRSDFQTILSKENFDGFLKAVRDIINDKLKDAFIFSTCEAREEEGCVHPKDNLYMWSHYANGHRGVAIEFDSKLVSDSVLAKSKLENPQQVVEDSWIEIEYKDRLPQITAEAFFEYVWAKGTGSHFDTSRFDEVFKSLLKSKADIWHLEQEWRLMWHSDETRLKFIDIPIADDSITAIYLGCRVDSRLAEDFRFEVAHNFPRAKLYKANIKDNTFALEYESFR